MPNEYRSKDWDALAKKNAMWAILTDPAKLKKAWNEDEFFMTGAVEIKGIMEYIDRLYLDIPKKRALDFGCGVGRLTRALASYFEEVIGVDISSSMVNLADKYNICGNKCKFYVNEKLDLSLFKDDEFDFIYSNIVLQHIHQKYSTIYIKELVRILRPAGVLIFQLPSKKTSPKSIKDFIKNLIPSFLLNHYMRIKYGGAIEMHCIEKNEVIKILTDAGGKVLDIKNDESVGSSLYESLRYCVTKVLYK
jgi:ubiquinone/menaquinone biosynthesis C-methylase UbiE